LPAFVDFVREMKKRKSEEPCFLYVLKSVKSSDDLYVDQPEVALFFSEPIADLDRKTIYRNHIIYGTFPWDHQPCRYFLSAFFNIADRSRGLIIKGYSVSQKYLFQLSDGNLIPHYRMKIKGIWHPENYGYPKGVTIGKLQTKDWQEMLKYFDEGENSKLLNSDFRVDAFEDDFVMDLR
jgi:hypothetical protein